MREFWVASGHHLTRRADHGGLVATPELIMGHLARPELTPPAGACAAEHNLHASLLADPLRPVSKADIAALADADARENWTFMMAFREQACVQIVFGLAGVGRRHQFRPGQIGHDQFGRRHEPAMIGTAREVMARGDPEFSHVRSVVMRSVLIIPRRSTSSAGSMCPSA